jgi:Zn-dependent protease/CBS domain-containing protein
MNGAAMSRGVRIGRIFGIQIAFDYSWIFIVVLLTWSLTVGFGRWHPDWAPVTALATAFVAALLFFVSVLLHELAHSLVARRFGIPVESITLFLFGGVSNIEREPPSAKAEFLMAIVGPLTSIVLGVVLLALGSLAIHVSADAMVDPTVEIARLTPAQSLLMWLGPINILVGVFNLIPGFPLDGGRVLRSILWAITRDLHLATRWASAVGQAIGWFLVFLGVAIAFGARVPFFGRGLVSGLWLAFIGWFLSSAAAMTWRRHLMQEILEGITVSRLMRPEGPAVRPEATLSSFVSDWLMRGDERAFPVVDDTGRLMGIAAMADVRAAPREAWDTTPVSQVMTPADRLVVTMPREDVSQALEKMVRADVGQLPVLDGSRLAGMLLRRDVARWVELHAQAGTRRYAH